MENFTDPARELVNVCEKIAFPNKQPGYKFVAQTFEVEPWTYEFHEIIFCIAQKIEQVQKISFKLSLDKDIIEDARNHLSQIGQAFSSSTLSEPWHSNGAKLLGKENLQPIKMLSGSVRLVIKYPKLSEEEVKKTLDDVIDLLDWLIEHQEKESDAIRQTIIEGFERLKFRLEKFSWLGWGYTSDSIREIVGAYLILNEIAPDTSNDQNLYRAMAMRIRGFLEKTNDRISTIKKIHDNGNFILKLYASGHFLNDANFLAGLLANRT